MEKIKEVVCPLAECGHTTEYPVHWEKVDTGYQFSLSEMEFTGESTMISENSEPTGWACPRCGEFYPKELQEALEALQ